MTRRRPTSITKRVPALPGAPLKLDQDLQKKVDRVARRPLVGGIVGGLAVAFFVAIDKVVYGGTPTLVGYLSIAMGVAILEAVLTGLGLSIRKEWAEWAAGQQRRRLAERSGADREDA